MIVVKNEVWKVTQGPPLFGNNLFYLENMDVGRKITTETTSFERVHEIKNMPHAYWLITNPTHRFVSFIFPHSGWRFTNPYHLLHWAGRWEATPLRSVTVSQRELHLCLSFISGWKSWSSSFLWFCLHPLTHSAWPSTSLLCLCKVRSAEGSSQVGTLKEEC